MYRMNGWNGCKNVKQKKNERRQKCRQLHRGPAVIHIRILCFYTWKLLCVVASNKKKKKYSWPDAACRLCTPFVNARAVQKPCQSFGKYNETKHKIANLISYVWLSRTPLVNAEVNDGVWWSFFWHYELIDWLISSSCGQHLAFINKQSVILSFVPPFSPFTTRTHTHTGRIDPHGFLPFQLLIHLRLLICSLT